MKIKRLHIDNFGRLSNVDLDFSSGITQIFNENGWGKTTLTIFIKAMFYGMSAARDNVKMERKKYMPWQGGRFGGYIDFVCEQGQFRIIRSFAKTPEGDENQLIDLDTNKEVDFPKVELGEWIFGVGKETFEMTAFFPQLNFLSGANEQISAGVLGLEKFKFDLANVGQAMTKIKKEISALKKNTVKQADIDRLSKQINELQLDLRDAEEEIKKAQAEMNAEQEIYSRLSVEVAKERQSIEMQEKLYLAKVKIEDEIKVKNEQLSSMLLALNQTGENQSNSKQKRSTTSNLVFFIAILMIGAGVGLGVSQVLSWIISGVICGAGLIVGVIAFLVSKKKGTSIIQESNANTVDEKTIEDCQNEINNLKHALSNYQDVQMPDKRLVEEKQQHAFNCKLKIERLSGVLQNLSYQRERLVKEIEELGEDIASKSALQGSVEEKIHILECTHEYLLQAKENVSARFVGPINRELKEFLSRFDMRGRDYVVDTNFDVKENTVNGIKPFEHSSQGYRDIVSLTMRFLLIKQIYKQENPFVLLDDSFVNLDDQNFDKAKEILDEFAKEYQIFYICCNKANRIKD
ncbi:MAG: AAA family ATPase [Clostridia bacterium]|nr:AAA family ATPase [Clostridia bacterium]